MLLPGSSPGARGAAAAATEAAEPAVDVLLAAGSEVVDRDGAAERDGPGAGAGAGGGGGGGDRALVPRGIVSPGIGSHPKEAISVRRRRREENEQKNRHATFVFSFHSVGPTGIA